MTYRQLIKTIVVIMLIWMKLDEKNLREWFCKQILVEFDFKLHRIVLLCIYMVVLTVWVLKILVFKSVCNQASLWIILVLFIRFVFHNRHNKLFIAMFRIHNFSFALSDEADSSKILQILFFKNRKKLAL